MATTSTPLKLDRPPKPATAQQYPRVVVGSSTKPNRGIKGLGTPKPANGASTKALLNNQHNSRITRGARSPRTAIRHMEMGARYSRGSQSQLQLITTTVGHPTTVVVAGF